MVDVETRALQRRCRGAVGAPCLVARPHVAARARARRCSPKPVPPPPPRSRAVRHPLVVFLNFVITIALVAVVGAGGGRLRRQVAVRPAERPRRRRARSASTRGTGVSAIADELRQGRHHRHQMAVRRRCVAEQPDGQPQGRRIPHPGPCQHARHHGRDGDRQGHPLFGHHSRGADQPADRRPPQVGGRACRRHQRGAARRQRCCRRPTSSPAATRARA